MQAIIIDTTRFSCDSAYLINMIADYCSNQVDMILIKDILRSTQFRKDVREGERGKRTRS